MKDSALKRTVFPLIAALVGYFLTWFLFGVSAFVLFPLVLGLALWLAYATEGKAGLGGFVLSFVLLLAVPAFILSLRPAVQFGNFTAGLGSEGVGITGLYVFGMLLVSSAVLFGAYFLAQRRGWRVWFPLTPWFFLLGVAAFAYAPAVEVDCRYANTNHAGGQQMLERRFPWIKAEDVSGLPGGQELAGEKLGRSYFFVSANCSRDKAGRPRMLSFRASTPLLLAYRESKSQENGGYAALFDPKTGQKLTRWHTLSGENNVYFLMRNYHPYDLIGELSHLFSRMQLYSYNQVTRLPTEFYADLRGEK